MNLQILEEIFAAGQNFLRSRGDLQERRLRVALATLAHSIEDYRKASSEPKKEISVAIEDLPTLPATITIELADLPILSGGHCNCGKRAVVRYVGKGFCWPRCGTCPGAMINWGVELRALPMEEHHRKLLKYVPDERIFLERAAAGITPPAIGNNGREDNIVGNVKVDVTLWAAPLASPKQRYIPLDTSVAARALTKAIDFRR